MQINNSVSLPSRLDLNENPVTELVKATDDWIDYRKLSSLDEWVSIPITALPFIIAIISILVPSRAVLLSVVAGGLSFLFWVGYKVAKAKKSIELRFFIITIFLQALMFFITNTTILILLIWSGVETALPVYWDIGLKLVGVAIGVVIIWQSMKLWDFGPCRVADRCWKMIRLEFQESSLDIWNHRESIQNQIGFANCRLCSAMMRPGMFIGIILELSFLVGLFGNITMWEVIIITVMFLAMTPLVIFLASRHVKEARIFLGNDLRQIDDHIELLHDKLPSR